MRPARAVLSGSPARQGGDVEEFAPGAVEAQARGRRRHQRDFRVHGPGQAAVEHAQEQRRGEEAAEPGHDAAEEPRPEQAGRGRLRRAVPHGGFPEIPRRDRPRLEGETAWEPEPALLAG